MQTLLIVLLIGCALLTVVHIGRGVWARSRSVERHQQALHTLATFTAPLQGTPGAHAGTGDHQAHVRVIGRNSPAGAGAPSTLPPPREVTLPGPVRTSPFRRPSHLDPSVAALDAVATSPVISARALPWVRRGSPPPPPRQRRDGDGEDATLPGMPPVRAGDGPPTRPVPVVQPQVFYFEDVVPGNPPRPLSEARGGPAPAPGPAPAALVAVGSQPAGRAQTEAGAGKEVRSQRSPVLRPLAIAAVSVAVAGVAHGVELDHPGRRAPVASHTSLPLRHPAAPARSTTTSVPAPTTTAAPPASTVPPEPAVLVSANGGTATYQLTSPTASIVVKANGPCWIEVKAGSPAGQVVVEETLSAGQRSSVTGPAWIRLGDPPHVAVTVDGTPMSVPGAGTAVPLDLQFTLSDRI